MQSVALTGAWLSTPAAQAQRVPVHTLSTAKCACRCHGYVVCLQVVREASRRVLGLRPFDVQLMGGMILHEGQIAEMRTGEVGDVCVCVWPGGVRVGAAVAAMVVVVAIWDAGRLYSCPCTTLPACVHVYSLLLVV